MDPTTVSACHDVCDVPVSLAPVWSPKLTVRDSWTLHQIAPYIGRMKASIAAHLVERWTKEGDLVVDPFGGCGTVALEAAGRGRDVIAIDWNPYAAILTKAKLFPPANLPAARRRLATTWRISRELFSNQDLRRVPAWVRAFFHSKTLKYALAFRDACVYLKDDFLLACFLGILHHERPGFLSYPSSHLVPYLRDRKYPRADCHELYEARDVLPRMERKIERTYRRTPLPYRVSRDFRYEDARLFPYVGPINTVITSPPYMNELDYVRDNRLRLWFIDRKLPHGLELAGRNRVAEFEVLMTSVCLRIAPWIVVGGRFVIVVGDATRGGGRTGRTGDLTRLLFDRERVLRSFRLEAVYSDVIPDLRRSRRECRGTKRETVLVFRKEREP